MRSSPFLPHDTTTNQSAHQTYILFEIHGLSEFYNGRKKTFGAMLSRSHGWRSSRLLHGCRPCCVGPLRGDCLIFQRLLIKAPSGRQRLNVLAALNAISHELFTVEHLTYITSETVCELLRVLARTHQGLPITMILDNARYQRCALVQAISQE
jgi:hypothetical protein